MLTTKFNVVCRVIGPWKAPFWRSERQFHAAGNATTLNESLKVERGRDCQEGTPNTQPVSDLHQFRSFLIATEPGTYVTYHSHKNTRKCDP